MSNIRFKRPDQHTQLVQLKVTPGMKADIQARVEATGRCASDLIRQWIEDGLQECCCEPPDLKAAP